MNISHTDYKSSPTNTTNNITGINPSFAPQLEHGMWFNNPVSPARTDIHLATLLAKKSYVPIPEDTLEQIMTADDLSAQAKLFHLLVVSLSIINHNATGNGEISLAVDSWAQLMNCATSTVFCMQKQLETKQYLTITRSKDQRNRDKRNILRPRGLVINTDNTNTKFLPLNYHLLKAITSHQELSSLQKLLWLDLYCMCYARFLRTQDDSQFSCIIAYSELIKKHNMSRATLAHAWQFFTRAGFITKQQAYIKHPDRQELHDRRDYSIWQILVTLPAHHLQQLTQTADRINCATAENNQDIEQDIGVVQETDPQYQQMEPLINTSFKIKKDRSTCAGILEDSEVMGTASALACSAKDDLFIKNGIGCQQDKKGAAATTYANSSTPHNNHSIEDSTECINSSRATVNALSTVQPIGVTSIGLTAGTRTGISVSTSTNSVQPIEPTTEASTSIRTSSGTTTSTSTGTSSNTNSVPPTKPTTDTSTSTSTSSVPGKSLKDFYPISAEDCAVLRHSSGRGFGDEAINEILSSIANKLERQPHFYSKRGFLAYMSKALQHEIRSPDTTNKPGFKILRMPQIVQRFLGTIENICNRYRTTNAIFKQRIANHIEPTKAYRLLKACKEIKPIAGTLHIYLTNQPAMMTLLTASDMHTITEQAIHTYKDITSVQFEQLALQCAPQETQGRNHFEEPIADEPADGESRVWHSIKKKFAAHYGNVLCNTWLPKLSTKTVTETEVLKYKNHESEVLLLEGGGFIVHWLQENYGNFFDKVAKELGLLIVMNGNTRGHIQSYRWNRE